MERTIRTRSISSIAASAASVLIAMATAIPAVAEEDELYISNYTGNSVTVYHRTAAGDVMPIRTLAGHGAGLDGPDGLAVDTVNDELIVASQNAECDRRP